MRCVRLWESQKRVDVSESRKFHEDLVMSDYREYKNRVRVLRVGVICRLQVEV